MSRRRRKNGEYDSPDSLQAAPPLHGPGATSRRTHDSYRISCSGRRGVPAGGGSLLAQNAKECMQCRSFSMCSGLVFGGVWMVAAGGDSSGWSWRLPGRAALRPVLPSTSRIYTLSPAVPPRWLAIALGRRYRTTGPFGALGNLMGSCLPAGGGNPMAHVDPGHILLGITIIGYPSPGEPLKLPGMALGPSAARSADRIYARSPPRRSGPGKFR